FCSLARSTGVVLRPKPIVRKASRKSSTITAATAIAIASRFGFNLFTPAFVILVHIARSFTLLRLFARRQAPACQQYVGEHAKQHDGTKDDYRPPTHDPSKVAIHRGSFPDYGPQSVGAGCSFN